MIRRLKLHNRTVLTFLLLAAFGVSLVYVPWREGVFHERGLSLAFDVIGGALQPAFSPDLLYAGLIGCLETLAYASAGMSLAVLAALPLSLLASGLLVEHPTTAWVMTTVFRGILALMRSIHELVWAWLFTAAFGLSPAAAILAIAIPYSGILGRIWADMLNDVKEKPVENLQVSGAGTLQRVLYGHMPMALPDSISYGMFRFECAVRSAAIMSFVGVGGIGYLIDLALEDLHFGEAWLYIYMLVIMVILVSIWSSELRRALTE